MPLKPKQAILIPHGTVSAELSLTPHSIISHWSWALPTVSVEPEVLRAKIDLAEDMLATELKLLDSPVPAIEKDFKMSAGYLSKLESQLQAAGLLLEVLEPLRPGWQHPFGASFEFCF